VLRFEIYFPSLMLLVFHEVCISDIMFGFVVHVFSDSNILDLFFVQSIFE